MTFALDYFGMEGLPEELEQIPVETVERGLKWLGSHPRVRGESIGVWGASKGAELALLAASLFSDIKAVVAKSASAYVFEGIGRDMGKVHKSSWTHGGKEVSFVPVEFDLRIGAGFGWARLRKRPWPTRPMYTHALKHAKDLQAAAIKVEDINGPVLVTGGGQDGVWPSDEMARTIAERLKTAGHPHDDVALIYPNAGHQVVSPCGPHEHRLPDHPRRPHRTPRRQPLGQRPSLRGLLAEDQRVPGGSAEIGWPRSWGQWRPQGRAAETVYLTRNHRSPQTG